MSAKKFAPYTPQEKALLLDLVHKYKNIIENKKTDASSNSQKKEAWKKITEEFNSNFNVSRRDETQLKRCWEKFKSQVRKQKQLERQHSMKTGGGEQLKTSPADDELAAQVLSIQPWLDEEVDTPWDSDYRHRQDAASVFTITHPENSTSTSILSGPHNPIPLQTPRPSTTIQTLPSSTYTPLTSISYIPGPSTAPEDFFFIPYSPSPPSSQSSPPHVPESTQHSSCENPASAPSLRTLTLATRRAPKVLKRAAKSRLSTSADSLVEAGRVFRSKSYEEELKQMREAHKKNMEKEDLLRAACAKREERFLEHQEQLQSIRLEQEQVILERERYIAERERYTTEQAKLAMRAAQLDVERKELDIKKSQGDK